MASSPAGALDDLDPASNNASDLAQALKLGHFLQTPAKRSRHVPLVALRRLNRAIYGSAEALASLRQLGPCSTILAYRYVCRQHSPGWRPLRQQPQIATPLPALRDASS